MLALPCDHIYNLIDHRYTKILDRNRRVFRNCLHLCNVCPIHLQSIYAHGTSTHRDTQVHTFQSTVRLFVLLKAHSSEKEWEQNSGYRMVYELANHLVWTLAVHLVLRKAHW